MVHRTKQRETMWLGSSAARVFPVFLRLGWLSRWLQYWRILLRKINTGWKFTGSRQRSETGMAPSPKFPKATVQLANPLTSSVAPGKAPLFLGPQFTVMTKSDSRDSCDPWTLDGFFFRARKPTRVTKTYFSPSKLRTFPDIHVCLSEWGWHRILKRGLNA